MMRKPGAEPGGTSRRPHLIKLQSAAACLLAAAIAASPARVTPTEPEEGPRGPVMDPAKSPRPGDPARMRVRLEAAKQSYRPLEPIELVVIVENISDKEVVRLWLAPALYPTIRIMVKGADGGEVPKTQYARYMSKIPAQQKSYGIAPRRDFRPKMLANLVNDMTEPGEYIVQVIVPFWSNANEGLHREAISMPLRLSVSGEPYDGPEDPAAPEAGRR